MNSFNIYSLLLTILYKKKVNNLFTNNLQFIHTQNKKKSTIYLQNKKKSTIYLQNKKKKSKIYLQKFYNLSTKIQFTNNQCIKLHHTVLVFTQKSL